MIKLNLYEKIGEGITSIAYSDYKNVILVGKKEDSLDQYYKLLKNLELVDKNISINIPRKPQIFGKSEQFPFGAIIYNGVSGDEIDKNILTEHQKKQIGIDLGLFLIELHGIKIDFDRDKVISQEKAEVSHDFSLIKNYISKDHYSKLTGFLIDYFELLDQCEICLTHGDLHRKNIIINDKNELAGIIDFGDLDFRPVEYDFSFIYDYDKSIYENMIKNYNKSVNEKMVKLCLLFHYLKMFKLIVNSKDSNAKKIFDKIVNYINIIL